MKLTSVLAALLLAAPSAGAQAPTEGRSPQPATAIIEEAGRSGAEANAQTGAAGHDGPGGGAGGAADIIMPHITDSKHLEVPCFNRSLACEVDLAHHSIPPLHLGGLTLDISPTKHVVMLLVAALLCATVLITAAAAHRRHSHAVGRPRGFAAGIEAVVLFIRDEVILKNVGPHGEGFVPFLLTMFFFVLFANALGLIPYGSTATGNISVTATLAVISFVAIELAGVRALGKGYINTILYWPSDMKFGAMKIFLAMILTPVELLGKFTKPFALAIRLFANMTAGHVIVLAFIGIIFTFGSWIVAPAPLLMAIGIMLLEVFVALLQAYIFTLLTSVFIGQMREVHH